MLRHSTGFKLANKGVDKLRSPLLHYHFELNPRGMRHCADTVQSTVRRYSDPVRLDAVLNRTAYDDEVTSACVQQERPSFASLVISPPLPRRARTAPKRPDRR
jgi:hypothetical protein